MHNLINQRQRKAPTHGSGGGGDLETLADIQLVRRLLATPRYEIPDHLRKNIIESASEIMADPMEDTVNKLAAARLVLEADKLNIKLVGMLIPKKIEHKTTKDLSTEELKKLIEDGLKSLQNSNPCILEASNE